MSGRIDTHIHALPPAYLAAVNAAGGDPSGFPSPEWSLDATVKLMDSISTSIGEIYELGRIVHHSSTRLIP